MALDISSPLPNVGGDLGTWGTKLNTAITEIINEAGKDSDIVSLQSTKVDKTNPVLDGNATGTATTTTGEADKLVKVNSSGRVILGGVDDGINKLQINGNAKLSGLAGTGNRMVVADANGNLSASIQVETGTWAPVLKSQGGGISVAGASNSGRYTKIGKLVMFSADVDWTSITGTFLGNRFISGLPYASSNTGSHGSAYRGSFTGLNCSPNRTLTLTVASGADIIYIGEYDLQSGGEYLQTVTINSSGSIIGLNGWYYTD